MSTPLSWGNSVGPEAFEPQTLCPDCKFDVHAADVWAPRELINVPDEQALFAYLATAEGLHVLTILTQAETETLERISDKVYFQLYVLEHEDVMLLASADGGVYVQDLTPLYEFNGVVVELPPPTTLYTSLPQQQPLHPRDLQFTVNTTSNTIFVCVWTISNLHFLVWDGADREFVCLKSIECFFNRPPPLMSLFVDTANVMQPIPVLCVGIVRDKINRRKVWSLIDPNLTDSEIAEHIRYLNGNWIVPPSATDEDCEASTIKQIDHSTVLVVYANLITLMTLDATLHTERPSQILLQKFAVESVYMDGAVVAFSPTSYERVSIHTGKTTHTSVKDDNAECPRVLDRGKGNVFQVKLNQRRPQLQSHSHIYLLQEPAISTRYDSRSFSGNSFDLESYKATNSTNDVGDKEDNQTEHEHEHEHEHERVQHADEHKDEHNHEHEHHHEHKHEHEHGHERVRARDEHEREHEHGFCSHVLKANNVAVIIGVSASVAMATAMNCVAIGMKVYLTDTSEQTLDAAKARVLASPGCHEKIKNIFTCVLQSMRVCDLVDFTDTVLKKWGCIHFVFHHMFDKHHGSLGNQTCVSRPIEVWDDAYQQYLRQLVVVTRVVTAVLEKNTMTTVGLLVHSLINDMDEKHASPIPFERACMVEAMKACVNGLAKDLKQRRNPHGVDLRVVLVDTQSTAEQSAAAPLFHSMQGGGSYCRVLFDFTPSNMSQHRSVENELNLRKGQILRLFGHPDDDGFHSGEHTIPATSGPQRGLVPCEFVEIITTTKNTLQEKRHEGERETKHTEDFTLLAKTLAHMFHEIDHDLNVVRVAPLFESLTTTTRTTTRRRAPTTTTLATATTTTLGGPPTTATTTAAAPTTATTTTQPTATNNNNHTNNTSDNNSDNNTNIHNDDDNTNINNDNTSNNNNNAPMSTTTPTNDNTTSSVP